VSQLDIPSAAELKGPSLGRMAPAAPPGAAAPRGVRIRTGKAQTPLKVEPGVCGGLGSLTAGDRPRWNGYRGAGPRRAFRTGHRPPLGLVGYPTAPKKGNPTLSYANLATGRSPGFGSMVGSPEGGRRLWRPTPLPPLRLVTPKLMAWTAAAGILPDDGQSLPPQGDFAAPAPLVAGPLCKRYAWTPLWGAVRPL